MAGFEWDLRNQPPELQSHSAAKLKLIELYLSRYFKIVSPDPRSDKLQISLIDGFCGGGAFLRDGVTVAGTPIIMLNSVKAAEQSLNKGRTKRIHIDARFYFVDESKSAISFLDRELRNRAFGPEIGNSIHLINETFAACSHKIVADIQNRARVGRSIFLLDQLGWNQVPFVLIRQIMSSLQRSEVILTFAVDWLIDYLSNNAPLLKGLVPIEITEQQLLRYIEHKGPPGWRYMIQRLLIQDLRIKTDAEYFTPFFLRSNKAGRDLWLIHLSKHPTARNVMTSTHWDVHNASIHQGPAGLRMLGFDPDWENTLPLEFSFDGNAHSQTEISLYKQLPQAVGRLNDDEAITFDALQRAIANETAARIDHIESTLMRLYDDKELEILTPTGQQKRLDAKLKSTDRIRLRRQPFFPGFKL